jgi:hypothetical protein
VLGEVGGARGKGQTLARTQLPVDVSGLCLVMDGVYTYIVCEPVVLNAVYIFPQHYIQSVEFLFAFKGAICAFGSADSPLTS